MFKHFIPILIIAISIGSTGVVKAEPVKITMHKQALCSCCDKHAKILKQEGFDVEIKQHDDINWLKHELNIPREFASCHTMIVGNYIVEGHVPGDIIKKLITEKPDIRGVALPGMPNGTPGMPGPRDGLLSVYVLNKEGHIVYDRF